MEKDNEYWKTLFHEMFEYDKETGKLYRKSGKFKGNVVGSVDKEGYRTTNVEGKKFSVHRIVACMFIAGFDVTVSSMEIDHKNRVRDDNRVENLRVADDRLQSQNREGVDPEWIAVDEQAGGFRAKIGIGQKEVHLGIFRSKEEATAAYLEAAEELRSTGALDAVKYRLRAFSESRGVSFDSRYNKWMVRITNEKVRMSLGYWSTREEAVTIYREAWLELYETGMVDVDKYRLRSRSGT